MTSDSAPGQLAGRPAGWLRPLRRRSVHWSRQSTLVLIVDVIVQELWRRHLGFPLNNLVVLAIDIGVDDGLIVRGQAVFESLLLPGQQIDAELVSQGKDVTSGITVSLGKLVGKLLHADLELGQRTFSLTLRDRHLLAESTIKQRLEVQQDRPWLG